MLSRCAPTTHGLTQLMQLRCRQHRCRVFLLWLCLLTVHYVKQIRHVNHSVGSNQQCHQIHQQVCMVFFLSSSSPHRSNSLRFGVVGFAFKKAPKPTVGFFCGDGFTIVFGTSMPFGFHPLNSGCLKTKCKLQSFQLHLSLKQRS